MLRLSRRSLCVGPSKGRHAAAVSARMTDSQFEQYKNKGIKTIQEELDAAKARMETFRAHNFSAGPASVPNNVLAVAQRDLMNYKDSGISFMELSHRDEDGPVHQMMKKLVSNYRKLLEIPNNYHVLFFQGGAHGQFAAVPLNLCQQGENVDYCKTGAWSTRAIDEAKKYANVHVCYDSAADGDQFIRDPKEWNFSPDSKYVHITMNETMSGLEFLEDPKVGDRILIADATSTLLSRPIDIEKYGMIYASSGKNIGPAGVCAVIVRDDVLDRVRPDCPSILSWKENAYSQPIPSIYNTPPTYLLYMAQLMAQHYIEVYGSMHDLEQRAIARADSVYKVMDESNGFYVNTVDPAFRSRMNCVFRIGNGDIDLERLFSAEAEDNGIFQLFGHKLMGGLRITLYNGIRDESVEAVLEFMKHFAAKYEDKLKK